MAWGFRNRLLLGVGVAVGISALAQLGLGYWVLLRAAEATVQRELLVFAQSLYQALDFTGPLPALKPEGYSFLLPFSRGRARVTREGRIYLSYGGPFPVPSPLGEHRAERGWMTQAWALPQGYALEVALPAPSLGYALGASLLAFPLALALALGITFLLLKGLLRPLGELARATEALSQERFPEPVPVPTGEDELVTLARSFNRMVEAVRAFLERERTFTRHAAHELRTPVAALRSQLEALERGLVSQEQALPRLKAQVSRLEGLLRDLLALARGEMTRERVGLKALLEELGREWPGLVLKVETEGKVWGPPDLLRQVVANLLTNAFRHGSPPVEVGLREEGEWLVLSVRDHGPGVPEARIPALGTPFHKGPSSSGSGLGLALVRHTVERLGGRVQWGNAHPGWRVVLWLPKEVS
ncbi:sensor histidine kinase [Thermus antranikianii]|uniref:histidine kinase n=1 Tax=Thermus antranikianii TaxID=88190 RepID=A0ABY7RP15_9DEIN|nr:HAMP domain-containing sensor histidine kinase [Thermus antranikianii]WCM39427.1 HAMP domain-containing protein [Thermus antranikianii]